MMENVVIHRHLLPSCFSTVVVGYFYRPYDHSCMHLISQVLIDRVNSGAKPDRLREVTVYQTSALQVVKQVVDTRE